jgi:DNA-binding response OmpR family regulator
MSHDDDRERTILLIEEDDDARPLLKRNLQTYGYRVLVTVDAEDAMQRAGEGSLHADLILMNLVGVSSDETLRAGRLIRQQTKLDVPLVVMAEHFGADVEGTNVNVAENDWITYIEDHDQLKNLLDRLTSNTGE